MITRRTIYLRLFSRKLAVLILLGGFTFGAFATLGDGKSKSKRSLINKRVVTPGKLSLRSGYQYRGSQVINQQQTANAITLNSVVTYQKGNMTYVMPLKTTVLTHKVKLGVGIPQLGKN